MTWARIEKATPHGSDIDNTNGLNGTEPYQNTTGQELAFLTAQPILIQYLFFLALCTVETASFHLLIRTLLSIRFPKPISILIPYYPHPALISTALLVSSFTKLFPLLLLIWMYDLPSSASAVSWAVIINNIAALEILLDCGYIRAAILAAIGAIFRAGTGWVCQLLYVMKAMTNVLLQGILRAVGVGGGVAAAGVVETEDLIEVWRRLTESVGLGGHW